MTSDAGASRHYPEGAWVGPYQIQGFLGSGATSDVYRAKKKGLDWEVALKIIRAEDDEPWDPGFVGMICHLHHPHIASINSAGRIDDRFVIAMDLVEGRSLRNILHEQGRLEPAAALGICSSVATTLEWAHTLSPEGLAHLNLKPSKILVELDGTVRITDFGLSQLLGHGIARAGSDAAWPAYLAPEQFDGRSSIQSDLWTVGVLLYEMLLGRRPYRGKSLEEWRTNICEQDYEIGADFIDLPLLVRKIILRCLRRDLEERYPSAHELAADLATAESALSPLKCPRCGTDLPRGRNACFDCSLTELRESLSEVANQGKGQPKSRIRRTAAVMLTASIALLVGGYLIRQSFRPVPSGPPEAAVFSSQPPAKPTHNPRPASTTNGEGDNTARDPAREEVPLSASARREWEAILALIEAPEGHYDDRIERLGAFIQSHSRTAEAKVAEGMLRLWQEESLAFRDAEAFELAPSSSMSAILAKWQEFHARQTTGLRRDRAKARIQYWNRQILDYSGEAVVSIRSASGLPLSDNRLFGLGQPDPFFTLLDGDRVLYRSRTLDDNTSPAWDEKARLHLWSGLKLILEIRDDDLLGSDLLVRKLLVPLPPDGDYQISSGDIQIELEVRREK